MTAPQGEIVWLASYPKSGNTWFRAILSAYLRDGPVILDDLEGEWLRSRPAIDRLVGYDTADMPLDAQLSLLSEVYRAHATAPGTRWLKTHAARLGDPGARLHPEEVTRAAIYVVRDPRDVVVSYASRSAKDLDTVVGWLCDPGYTLAAPSGRRRSLFPEPLGTWSQHVTSWVDADDPPAYVLRYEDMLADPLTAVAGALACAGLRVDPARLRRAMEASRFEVLSEAEGRLGFMQRGLAAPFFRSGTAGVWRTALSAGQASRIVAAHGRVMARLGYAAV